jgi:hypothetical protein
MMATLAAGAVVAALVIGFLAGFVTFRRSLRWCPTCGAGLRCLECPGRPLPFSVAAGRDRGVR